MAIHDPPCSPGTRLPVLRTQARLLTNGDYDVTCMPACSHPRTPTCARSCTPARARSCTPARAHSRVPAVYIPYSAAYPYYGRFKARPIFIWGLLTRVDGWWTGDQSRHMTAQVYGRTRSTVRCTPLLPAELLTDIFEQVVYDDSLINSSHPTSMSVSRWEKRPSRRDWTNEDVPSHSEFTVTKVCHISHNRRSQ